MSSFNNISVADAVKILANAVQNEQHQNKEQLKLNIEIEANKTINNMVSNITSQVA